MPNESNVTVNPKYKDSIFRLLFAEDKENALSLYNAVNGTSHTNAEDLIFNNLEDAFYVNIKNDASFVFSKSLNLYEHQSTFNPNMPLRGMFYAAAMYRGMIDSNNLYDSTLLKIPTPHFIVFYNGTKDIKEDIKKLRLSDMFETVDGNHEYEWTATMININHGHSQDLMDACKVLKDYAIFIETVRKYHEEYKNRMSLEECKRQAVQSSIDDCIKNDVLKDFLLKHKKEVIDMSLFEFDETAYQNLFERKGHEKGLAEGRIEAIKKLITKDMTKEFILSLDYSEEEYNLAKESMLQTV